MKRVTCKHCDEGYCKGKRKRELPPSKPEGDSELSENREMPREEYDWTTPRTP